jgi:hypothetical protein
MKLSRNELIIVAVVIGYIAFFTHPPPSHITNLLETPIGHVVALLGILYVTVYQSLLVGVFLGIAYIMTSPRVTEYMDEKQQKPTETAPPQPKSTGVPPPAVTGVVGDSMKKKGDTRLPQAQGKSNTTKPTEMVPPKPASPPPTVKSGVENFASF